MKFQRIGIVGCGQMGSGIAQVAAEKGYPVVVREPTRELVEAGLARIEGVLAKNVSKGKITAEQKAQVMGRLTGTVALDGLSGCDLVIEAIVEQLEAKRALWTELDRLCPPATIFASNTSSISVTEMAAATRRPDQFMGMHFFNPVPVMKLVELVRPLQAKDETHRRIRELAVELRENVIEAKDTPGFIVNLLLVPYLMDAIRAVEAGIATPEDIDTGMRIGCGHPMGPLALGDFVGLDTCLFIADVLHRELGDAKYSPPPLLRRMVAAGRLGKKSGRGFYTYSS